MTKEQILAEIRQRAVGTKALSQRRFFHESPVTPHQIKVNFGTYGAAVIAAGLQPNKFSTEKTDDEVLIKEMIQLIREFKGFPKESQWVPKYNENKGKLHSLAVFSNRFGSRQQDKITRIIQYCQDKDEYKDIIQLLEPYYSINNSDSSRRPNPASNTEYVYMFKVKPGLYKVGKSELPDVRKFNLEAISERKLKEVHRIETHYPEAVETYWHLRFKKEGKWVNRELFRLDQYDIGAFKRWKDIF